MNFFKEKEMQAKNLQRNIDELQKELRQEKELLNKYRGYCKDYDRKTGKCTTCYDGYSLALDGECKVGNSENIRANNPLCA